MATDQRVMRFALTVALMIFAGPFSSGFALATAAETSNPVIVWNQLTTTLGLSHKLPPPFLAHDYALVQVAIYDALLSNANNKTVSQTAIVAGAAHEVLSYLFPMDATTISSTFNSQLTSITRYTSDNIQSATKQGEKTGDAVIAYAQTDGSSNAWDGVIPTGPCMWNGYDPVGPLFGLQKTFILTSADEYQPPPPYPCGSKQDLQDVQSVVIAQDSITSEEVTIVHKWADRPPPTIWNNWLDDRIANHSLNTFEAARASVYLNVGMYDAFVSCWATKYTYWTARPYQRIPGFVPVITTPNFPSYASGHSTISSAASLIMAQLFPEEASFFIAQAQEAAISRLWAGIHFPQDNNNGFVIGQLIGAKVVSDMQSPAHAFVLARNLTTSQPSFPTQETLPISAPPKSLYILIGGVAAIIVVGIVAIQRLIARSQPKPRYRHRKK